MRTEDLIDRIARDAAPVAPLPAPGVRTVAWVLWAALYLIAVGVIVRTTMPAGGATLTPVYVLQQCAALFTAIAAARAAFVSVIPGAPAGAWTLALAGASAWLAAGAWGMWTDLRVAGTIGMAAHSDWPCVISMMFGGLVLAAPLVWLLRRGAPLTPRTTGFLAGLAALSVANIEACLTRPHQFVSTVLLWHGATAVLLAFVSATAGHHWLRWRPRATQPVTE
jgi:hypothetical protein